MVEPLVSVHMITYNHAPYIARAIEGVLEQQTDFPYELVIGEDCSTDGTREIVSRFAEQYPDTIRVVTSEQNVGMRANSRRTLEACRGVYVAWCEGDDYWHRKDKLHRQVGFLQDHPEFGMVYSDYDHHEVLTHTTTEGLNSHRGLVPPENPTVRDLLLGRCGIITCTVCARLDLVRRLDRSDPEFDSGRFLMGDTPLWAELLAHSRAHYIPESLATHNILPESAAHSRSPLRQHRFYVSVNDMRTYMAQKHGLSASDVSMIKQDLHRSSLFLAFLEGDKAKATHAWRGLESPTLRERLLHFSVIHPALNYAFRVAWTVKRKAASLFSARLGRRRNRGAGSAGGKPLADRPGYGRFRHD